MHAMLLEKMVSMESVSLPSRASVDGNETYPKPSRPSSPPMTTKVSRTKPEGLNTESSWRVTPTKSESLSRGVTAAVSLKDFHDAFSSDQFSRPLRSQVYQHRTEMQ